MRPVTDFRVIAPFLPNAGESELHRGLAQEGFDWMDALRMVVASARQSNQCPVHVVTTPTADLPVPTLRYVTTETRLMLWLLEACVCYLQSADFDRDTVMLDVDQLIVGHLAPHFPDADLGVLIRRPKHPGGQVLLNGVQFWRVAAKDRLARFYTRVLATARTLSPEALEWGADGDALRLCLEPISVDYHLRSDLKVAFISSHTVLEEWSSLHMEELRGGRLLGPSRPVYDFRYRRKRYMRAVFDLWLQKTTVSA